MPEKTHFPMASPLFHGSRATADLEKRFFETEQLRGVLTSIRVIGHTQPAIRASRNEGESLISFCSLEPVYTPGRVIPKG
jgi:hypothetical protein